MLKTGDSDEYYIIINLLISLLTTSIQIYIFGPIVTKLCTEVPSRVAGWTMKQKVSRVHYLKVHTEQK